MEKELVSVIITTYERTTTLKRALSSVLSQTYDNLEIIVVDDNKDMKIRKKVKQIVEGFSDSRIKLVCNKKNLGGALSRNEGIKVARGKYLSFLDDDDEYYPNRIERQYDLFNNSTDDKLALVYTYCREEGKNGNREYKYNYKGHCIYESMMDCIAATSQWFCRKDFLCSVGMFSDVPCKQDSTVILKLLLAGFTIDRVPEILSVYHTDEIIRISSNNHVKRIDGEERLRELCRKNYKFIDKKLIKNVEYSFACRLSEHYLAVGQYRKFTESFKLILKRIFNKHSLRVYKHLLSIVIINLKSKINRYKGIMI